VRRYEVLLAPDPATAEMPGRLPGPYVAETYPVSVEDPFIIVEIPE
jgi:hypothetical protein